MEGLDDPDDISIMEKEGWGVLSNEENDLTIVCGLLMDRFTSLANQGMSEWPEWRMNELYSAEYDNQVWQNALEMLIRQGFMFRFRMSLEDATHFGISHSSRKSNIPSSSDIAAEVLAALSQKKGELSNYDMYIIFALNCKPLWMQVVCGNLFNPLQCACQGCTKHSGYVLNYEMSIRAFNGSYKLGRSMLPKLNQCKTLCNEHDKYIPTCTPIFCSSCDLWIASYTGPLETTKIFCSSCMMGKKIFAATK